MKVGGSWGGGGDHTHIHIHIYICVYICLYAAFFAGAALRLHVLLFWCSAWCVLVVLLLFSDCFELLPARLAESSCLHRR